MRLANVWVRRTQVADAGARRSIFVDCVVAEGDVRRSFVYVGDRDSECLVERVRTVSHLNADRIAALGLEVERRVLPQVRTRDIERAVIRRASSGDQGVCIGLTSIRISRRQRTNNRVRTRILRDRTR